MYSSFIQDPTQKRLNDSYLKLCASGDAGKDTLILNGACFEVINGSSIVSQFCALKGLAYPVDNASVISHDLLPGETLELFDNQTEQYTISGLPSNKTFVRGILLYVTYPNSDNNGDDIKPIQFESQLTLTTASLFHGAPNVSAGIPSNIIAPINATTLLGTATPNGGAAIVSTVWTNPVFPIVAATITSPATLAPSISNLVPGKYEFDLTVTDSNGDVSICSTDVVVSAALATPPTVSAGSSFIINAPTSTVTLTGTATIHSPATLVSTLWDQTGGPTSATIVSSSALSTVVNGLTVPGIYSFKFTVLDSAGQTTIKNTTVIVHDLKTINLPLNSFFSHFSNPITTDATQILNSLSVTNVSSNFPICVKAMLVYDKSDDPLQNNGCNC